MSEHGILIVNKPAGKTSRWVTNRISRLLGQKKAGHLGTLDPLATGVLPVVLGNATRLIRFLENDAKLYQGVIRLGAATDPQDAAGKVVSEGDWKSVGVQEIEKALAGFVGEIEQIPPMHSAVKKDGKPLYKLARQGIEIDRDPRKVTVFSAELVEAEPPLVTVKLKCSPGTYMRTIAHDLGEKLGCGAHLESLVRLANGPFTIDQAVELENLDPKSARLRLIPLKDCLPHFPAIEVTSGQAQMIRDGVSITTGEKDNITPGDRYRIVLSDQLVAVARAVEHGERILLKPLRVFSPERADKNRNKPPA